MPDKGNPPLEVRVLGIVPYEEGLTLQEELVRERRKDAVPDQLLLLEHPHVFTLGSSSREDHLLLSPQEREEKGIQLFEAGRGGDVTYHGPGQLVGYAILDLKPDRKDLHRFLRDLEEVLILTLREFGIFSGREEGLTGVWVPEGKLAAIGVRVSSGWITSHGFALNVDPEMEYFSSIIPCGISHRPVTSMAAVLGRPVQLPELYSALTRSFESVFQREPLVV